MTIPANDDPERAAAQEKFRANTFGVFRQAAELGMHAANIQLDAAQLMLNAAERFSK